MQGNSQRLKARTLRSSAWAMCSLVGLVSLLAVGCAGTRSIAEHATVRDGMDAATRTIRAEHKEWSKLAHDGGTLPKLSDFDYSNRLAAHKDYENLVNTDRARDGGVK